MARIPLSHAISTVLRLLLCGFALLPIHFSIAGSLGNNSVVERGKTALLTKCYSQSLVSRLGYESLWKQWGSTSRPADFDQQVMDRYGLHSAPYRNAGLPMGLRPIDDRP